MNLTSSAFEHGGPIPQKYTCDGEGAHPPLSIADVPEAARSLALVVDDPDVPKEVKADGVFDHWVLYNIPVSTTEIPEGETVGDQGKNGMGQLGYVPPCPPPQYEPPKHRYVFTLYALDTDLSIADPTKEELLAAVQGHILEQTQLIGKYERK